MLRGDGAQALQALTAVPVEEFAGADRDYRSCMHDRFARSASPPMVGTIEDPFARSVLASYQAYWWTALTTPSRKAELETNLQQDLRKLLGEPAGAAPDFDALEALLRAELEKRGYHALTGLTPPLRELMLWRKQTRRDYDVALPEGPQRVRVELLDDFVSLGWGAYGRCDRGSTGGWATEEALFAVVPVYKDGLESDAFQVVFLGHEAQHFADKHRFKDLENWELEYRAKLVELVQAGATLSQKRLGGFITSQGSDPAAPHPYANKQVVDALAKRLGSSPDTVPLAQLQDAAREELFADTRRRLSKH
ncbi:hypothetical protein EER27_08740 [Lysobacter psychrotolerans]|uniref:Uncharacterized protein n=1 Tax=Montanilutibacter psychrotolerans TaxID=1327343 RepID=A0A3M8ST05_9GAMM|nr:hypothetical protein EER27_08740 [Lysobacter psychrotolerans]